MKKLLCSLAGFWLVSAPAWSNDTLLIISAHRKSIQDEYIPKFKEFYQKTYGTPVDVDWLDQGGAESDLKFLQNKYANNPNTSGIDVFWGGGDMIFSELDKAKVLEKYELPKELDAQIPASVMGVAIKNANKTWYGQALSSFGIFYNKRLLGMLKLPEPKTWEDLANPAYNNQVSLADPRRSSSNHFMNIIMVESLGWQNGWKLLTAMAANAKGYAQSSSDPIKHIVEGNAAVAPVIDYYASAKILSLGENNLGFALPKDKTVFNSDPIAILKGAPNRKTAERFLNYVLGVEGQRLLILAKGAPQGPQVSEIARMAVNPKAYEGLNGKKVYAMNPFTMPSNTFVLNYEHAGKIKKVLGDLIGVYHVDMHKDLRATWTQLIKRNDKDGMAQLVTPPFSEAELMSLASKWDDNVFRNQTINKWVSKAQELYARLGKPNS